jgi:SanA protein
MTVRRLRKLRQWRRNIVIGVILMVVAGLVMATGPRLYATYYAQSRIYSAEAVPERPVAIVFGARVYSSGRPSPMLADRVKTGADLYHAGKVDVLLLTGDNHQVGYNEPEAMRRYAHQLGVPDDALVLDYAGLRTYDSCYRARDIFHVEAAILVTQDFHLDRALLTCSELGIDAVGVPAESVHSRRYSLKSTIYSHAREFPATSMAVLDLLLRPKPILGDALPIFEDRR